MPLLTPPSARENGGVLLLKAGERKELLTDKMIPLHFTGGEEEDSQKPAELLISGALPSRRSGSMQRYIKGKRSPAPAEPQL